MGEIDCPARPQINETSALAIGAPGFTFGPQQQVALKTVEHWLKHDTKTQPIFRLFGFAGSGKTTLARFLAANVNGHVCFAAYTGKAALMLRRAGCTGASTIHKALYIAKARKDGSFDLKIDREGSAAGAKLIVIDECSMADEQIGADLLSLGVPILALGDPAQLPPVKSGGFFTNVEKPDVMLTEIHRQAQDNPIIRVATAVRERRPLAYGTFGTVEIDRPGRRSVEDVMAADQILVGRNATREAFNARIRRHMGRETPFPVIGDRLVCLRNDRDLGIFNGGLFEVEKTYDGTDIIPMKIRSEDDELGSVEVRSRPECFKGNINEVAWRKRRDCQEFTYGYALTCHKSQGSQWDHVVVYDESRAFEMPERWLYTAVTRASERLTLIM